MEQISHRVFFRWIDAYSLHSLIPRFRTKIICWNIRFGMCDCDCYRGIRKAVAQTDQTYSSYSMFTAMWVKDVIYDPVLTAIRPNELICIAWNTISIYILHQIRFQHSNHWTCVVLSTFWYVRTFYEILDIKLLVIFSFCTRVVVWSVKPITKMEYNCNGIWSMK